MHRLTVLYGRPADPETFDRYYVETHLPLAEAMQGLTGWNLTWTSQQDGDLEVDVHLVVDLYAEDRAAMDAVLASPEGRAAADDVPNFATGASPSCTVLSAR